MVKLENHYFQFFKKKIKISVDYYISNNKKSGRPVKKSSHYMIQILSGRNWDEITLNQEQIWMK